MKPRPTDSLCCLPAVFWTPIMLAYFLERELLCPVCHDIFKHPIFLSCCHCFCKTCLCLDCKRRSSRSDPPSILVLINLYEAFLVERDQRALEALCCFHTEKLKLFSLNHKQKVCLLGFRKTHGPQVLTYRWSCKGSQEKTKLIFKSRRNQISWKNIRKLWPNSRTHQGPGLTHDEAD